MSQSDELDKPYREWFPVARSMRREFTLHVGPTNSGKTHSALSALSAAPTGTYLSPLRLLALETGEKLIADGLRCSIVTGEERRITPGATHSSRTVETMDPSTQVDVAVIDEAQMIADPDRGGAWSTAIMGTPARSIHVCLPMDALKAVEAVIRDCGDSWTVVHHERKSPLIVMDETISLTDTEPGDAYIAFNKASVLETAASLEELGHKVSVVYGALPWEVRQEEAHKFLSGESDVVVATDAIGMGLNLPVHRVVFTTLLKYDPAARKATPLNCSAIKQIAGRAGRYGIVDEGYVTALSKQDLRRVKTALTTVEHIDPVVYVNAPMNLLENSDEDLTSLLERWGQCDLRPLFSADAMSGVSIGHSGRTRTRLELAYELDDVTSAAQAASYRALAPLTRSEELDALRTNVTPSSRGQLNEWRRLCRDYYLHGDKTRLLTPDSIRGLVDETIADPCEPTLNDLESLCSLLSMRRSFAACLQLDVPALVDAISDAQYAANEQINRILAETGKAKLRVVSQDKGRKKPSNPGKHGAARTFDSDPGRASTIPDPRDWRAKLLSAREQAEDRRSGFDEAADEIVSRYERDGFLRKTAAVRGLQEADVRDALRTAVLDSLSTGDAGEAVYKFLRGEAVLANDRLILLGGSKWSIVDGDWRQGVKPSGYVDDDSSLSSLLGHLVVAVKSTGARTKLADLSEYGARVVSLQSIMDGTARHDAEDSLLLVVNSKWNSQDTAAVSMGWESDVIVTKTPTKAMLALNKIVSDSVGSSEQAE